MNKVRIICDVPFDEDESGANGLWDLAGKLAETAGLACNVKGPVYANEYGQEDIYNILRSLVVEVNK